MNFGKKLILINAAIIVLLTAIIVITAALASRTVIKTRVQNHLIGVVTERAAELEDRDGIIPDDFRFIEGEVYLSIFYSDGTLKCGSAPGEYEQGIHNGVVTTAAIAGEKYYVYDFSVYLGGRDDIYIRGIVSTQSGVFSGYLITISVLSVILAIFAIIFGFAIVKRAVRPITEMRREINAITETGDLTRRLNVHIADEDLSALQRDYNFMLDGLEQTLNNHERFTSDVAHELRTPLTVILSESEYALNEAPDEEERKASLAVIQRQTRRLVNTTNQLLDFTRFAEKVKIELKSVDFSAVCRDAALPEKRENGIEIITNIDDGVNILGEPVMAARLVQNIVDNAVKYGKADGKVWISLSRASGAPVLTVRDDGIGMDEECLKHAFDRFYQADKTRSGGKGLGLGLSFVKEIARLFGAEITVDSKVGEGTSFSVKFLPAEHKQ